MIMLYLVYLTCGLVAGTFGGLLGLGGGVILIPVLHFIFGLDIAQASGISIFAVVFTTIGGSIEYYKLKRINLKFLLPVIIFGVLSSILFSLVFSFLATKEDLLKIVIGCALAITSLAMIKKAIINSDMDDTANLDDYEYQGSLLHRCLIGLAGGVLPGLLGLGGGIIMVPALNFILKLPMKIAIAASLFSYMFNAIISSGIKLSQGYIDLNVAIPIGVGTFTGSIFGAKISRHIPSSVLRGLFGVAVGYVSVKFIVQSI
jgi:uncharacterized membrane protein YfcA